MEILGASIMEWQAITTIVASSLIVTFFGYINYRIGKIDRTLKLREYENRAMANIMFKDNGKKAEYDAEITRLKDDDSYIEKGRT